MSDPDEYVEPDKNRRRLAFVAVPTAVIALVLLDHFADRELQDYLRYLDTLALEGLEREILRLTHLSYLLAAPQFGWHCRSSCTGTLSISGNRNDSLLWEHARLFGQGFERGPKQGRGAS